MNGAIPAELGQPAKLQYLELIHNALSGELPAELGNLAKLNTLILDGNDLSEAIPAELASLSKLRTLHLAGNPKLTECVPYVLWAVTADDHGLRLPQQCG